MIARFKFIRTVYFIFDHIIQILNFCLGFLGNYGNFMLNDCRKCLSPCVFEWWFQLHQALLWILKVIVNAPKCRTKQRERAKEWYMPIPMICSNHSKPKSKSTLQQKNSPASFIFGDWQCYTKCICIFLWYIHLSRVQHPEHIQHIARRHRRRSIGWNYVYFLCWFFFCSFSVYTSSFLL